MIGKKLQALGKKNGKPAVIGFDPSAKMLSYAAKKIEEEKLTKIIQLIQGDAQDMHNIRDNHYDKISMAFGIRNVPDRIKALNEIHRVMKFGGKIIIMEFSTPFSGWLAPLTRFILTNFVPLMGQVIAGGHLSEYDHLRDSILNFPSPDGFKEMIKNASFINIISKNIFFDVVHLYIFNKKEAEISFDSWLQVNMVDS